MNSGSAEFVSVPQQSSCNVEFSRPTPILSLPERIERIDHALTAEDLAKLLCISKITVFKQAKAGRIPSFRVGTCVRFDPRAVANWLRKQ